MMRLIAISLLLTFPAMLSGQTCSSERYLENIFQSSVSQNVVYGASPALTAVYVAENVTVDQQMTMDVYLPVADGLLKRPLVILAYGGGFLVGTKEDEDVAATCDSLAKKGYVAASINYRMNMNIADPSSAVRAIYRAAQDYHAAIRYLKEYSNVYGIDTNYVFVGGVSAGGFSAMHAVFMDDNERPSATFQSGLLGLVPDLGCISCSGNNFTHTSNVRGVINLWGAVLDTSFIQQNELVPMTLFHGTNDLIVPYAYGFPFTALFLMPEVYGSANITARINNLGGNAELNTFQGVGHNIWGVNVNNQLVGGPTEHWTPITDSIISFLYENIRPPAPLVDHSGAACEGDTVELTVLNMPPDGRACWTLDDGDIVFANADSSTVHMVWTQAGNYEPSVVVYNHLDASSETTVVPITVYALPIVELTNVDGILQASGAYSFYQWYLDGIQIPEEYTDQLIPTANGVYTVLAIEANTGCSAFSNELLIVGLENAVRQPAETAFVKVYDIQGRLIADLHSDHELLDYKWEQTGLVLLRYFDADRNILKQEKQMVSPSF